MADTATIVKSLARRLGAALAVAAAVVLLVASGCTNATRDELVVYAALDREFSEPILNDFQSRTGVRVLAKYDVESTKTVGLVTALVQESKRPRCDVFWNNEILHTLRLQKLGLLDVYKLPDAASFPANYQSPRGTWYAMAARARVLLVNTQLIAEEDRPTSVRDLADPRWKGKCGLAKPLFGTTATHAAVLFSRWGGREAEAFFKRVNENAQVMSGNKQVAIAVGQGQLAFGLTDTDDALVELDRGMPVAIVFPDQGDDQSGTLLIPNTLCILRGAPHAENARRLLDFLLSPEVETRLAEGSSGQFPLHRDVQVRPRVASQDVRWMDVDFQAAADAWDEASRFLRGEFDRAP
jgi:iron(III) transport system substrate-binding protein